MFYLEGADGSLMSVTLQHHLDVLHRLLSSRTGAGHLVGYLLCSFLQLEIRLLRLEHLRHTGHGEIS